MIKPRQKATKAWTDLPDDFKLQVVNLFKSHFKDQSKSGSFKVLGRIYKNEVVLRCTYLAKGSITPIQFDLSTDIKMDSKAKPLEIFELLVDCAANLFQSSFEDETFGVPAIWTEIDFDGTLIYAKSESINPELEDEANKILGEEFLSQELEGEPLTPAPSLIKGELDSDDIEVIADILNKNKKQTH